MDRDTYLTQLASDGARITDLARGDLDAPVPTCPDWTLRDLIEHTGFVHRWQTAVVRDDTESFPDETTWRHGPADGQSLADWFQAGVDEAVQAYSAVEAHEPRWTWFPPDQTAGWYFRRTTHETVVHRIDAELAATGTAGPVDPAVAVDGIDEMFDVFVPASGDTPVGGSGQTLHLHATDGDGEWVVTLLADTVAVERTHAKSDAAVRGRASDLLLFVWGRDPIGALEVLGDESVRDVFFAACKI